MALAGTGNHAGDRDVKAEVLGKAVPGTEKDLTEDDVDLTGYPDVTDEGSSSSAPKTVSEGGWQLLQENQPLLQAKRLPLQAHRPSLRAHRPPLQADQDLVQANHHLGTINSTAISTNRSNETTINNKVRNPQSK
ncbi:hypothetical protein MMC08_003117 [Hypocenomyce scalaris]|nr:hypothetical protein [Hypocenomyce scalaris]